MGSSVNIYFYVIIYIILLFFVLSNNKEKTAIVTLIAISILLYSNLEINKLCKTIIGIMMITQLLQLYNFNKIKETMGDWSHNIPNPRESPFAAPLHITTYYVDDDGNKCGNTADNECDLQSNIDLYDYIYDLHAIYPNHRANKDNLIGDLNSINNQYYTIISAIDNKLTYFFDNVGKDEVLCNDGNMDYNLTKDKYISSCEKLNDCNSIIIAVNNLIGGKRRTGSAPSNFTINCSNEGFVGRNERNGFTSKVTREIQYFTNSYNKNVLNIKEGGDFNNDYEATKFTPQSGWFKFELADLHHTTTSIFQLNKVEGGGLLCEIFDINENEYNTIKNDVAPATYKDFCTTIKIPTFKTVWNDVKKCNWEKFEGFREGKRKNKKKKKNKKNNFNINKKIKKVAKKIVKIFKPPTKPPTKPTPPPRWVCNNIRVPKIVTTWNNKTNCINKQTAPYSINDNTPINLLRKISNIRNNGDKLYPRGSTIKSACNKYGKYQKLWTYNVGDSNWTPKDATFDDDDIFINPMAIINNMEVMNYNYRRNEFNSITRGPTMLATTCDENSFMNYFLFITGKITFKFYGKKTINQDWFKLEFKSDDYGCIIIHPTSKNHHDFNNEDDFENSIVLQTSKWLSGRQPANRLHEKYRTLKKEGRDIFNASLEKNTLKLSVANADARNLIKENGVSFYITIMYMQHYGGGNLRFHWQSSEDTSYYNINLHDGPYKPRNLYESRQDVINPGIIFSPNTPCATLRNNAFSRWYLKARASTNLDAGGSAWIFASKNMPFDRSSTINLNQYIAARHVLPRVDKNNLYSRPDAFTGKREGLTFTPRANDIINRPCPCLRIGVRKNKGDCNIDVDNDQLAVYVESGIETLHTRVSAFYDYAYTQYFGRVVEFRKHVLRVMLKNLLCRVFLEDGILLNNPPSIYNDQGYGAAARALDWAKDGNLMNNNHNLFTSNDGHAASIINSNVKGINNVDSKSDALAQRIRALYYNGSGNSYIDEINKVRYLYNSIATFSMKNEITDADVNMEVPSLRDTEWPHLLPADVEIPGSENDLKFYNLNDNQFNETEYNDWVASINVTLEMSTSTNGGSLWPSYTNDLSVNIMSFNYEGGSADINFAGQEYEISLRTDEYPNHKLHYIDNVIEQALALDNSIYKDTFTGRKEGFNSTWNSTWVKTQAGANCADDFDQPQSGLMSENCIKQELGYIFDTNNDMEVIYNLLKQWFCDSDYSPNTPVNFFQDLNNGNIKCEHRTPADNCDQCMYERYSISYSHNENLSSDPSYKIKQCIDFVIDFLEFYDKTFCFLEKFNYAYNNNIINGPNGLIALFPLDRDGEFPLPNGGSYRDLVSCKHNTFEEIESLMNDINSKYYDNSEFILYPNIRPTPPGTATPTKLIPFESELTLINRNAIVHRVTLIKKSENDLVNYVYENKLNSFKYVPSVISNCYSKDNISSISNDSSRNIITCQHDGADDLYVIDEQAPWRSMYIQQQSNKKWGNI